MRETDCPTVRVIGYLYISTISCLASVNSALRYKEGVIAPPLSFCGLPKLANLVVLCMNHALFSASKTSVTNGILEITSRFQECAVAFNKLEENKSVPRGGIRLRFAGQQAKGATFSYVSTTYLQP